MECYYHPNRESTDNCAICGKSVCKECGLEIAGKVYCKECLEKIVGLNLAGSAQQEPEAEPVKAEKEETPEAQIEMANLTKSQPPEVEFSTQPSHKIAEDSPYNIKDNIEYEGGVDSIYEDYQPKASLQQAIESNQEVVPEQPVEDVREEYIQQPVEDIMEEVIQEPVEDVREEIIKEEVIQEEIIPEPVEEVIQEPVEDVREEYVPEDPIMEEVLREPITQARNEFDSQPKPQEAESGDYIYPDHSYEPEETSARLALEDKYAKYLDDLYFDEEEIPLNEQLARDEAKFGSLTRNEYPPKNAHEQKTAEDDDLDRRIREELNRREDEKKHPKEQIHNFDYKDEKEPIGVVDIILTIILVIVILIVLFYIVYLFMLSNTYPTFLDAVFGLAHPRTFLSNLLNH